MIRQVMKGRTLIIVAQEEPWRDDYDLIVRFQGSRSVARWNPAAIWSERVFPRLRRNPQGGDSRRQVEIKAEAAHDPAAAAGEVEVR